MWMWSVFPFFLFPFFFNFTSFAFLFFTFAFPFFFNLEVPSFFFFYNIQFSSHMFVDLILIWIVTWSWWLDQPSGVMTFQRTTVDILVGGECDQTSHIFSEVSNRWSNIYYGPL